MKILLVLFILLFSFSVTNAEIDIEDTSIVDKLEKQEVKKIDLDIKLKKFNSCENLEDVMGKYIKDYWLNNKEKFRPYPVRMYAKGIVGIQSKGIEPNIEASSDISGEVNDFSKTNTQVDGVDESDIVKTDGKYIYYYNEKDKYVYIVKQGKLEIIKKIKLPKNFSRPVLYIGKNRLIIVSTGYKQIDYSKFSYFITRNVKTYTIVFDTTDIKNPILSKLYISDGDLRKSRKIGNYLYVVSNNSFNVPYNTFKTIDDIKIDASKIIPKSIDLSKTDNINNQNLKLRGKKFPYNIKSGNVAKCNEIEYVLPDEETIKKYDFSPSYNIISIINIENTEEKVKTKIIAGSNSELYMSLDNMYLTSNIYKDYNFTCAPGMYCILPWYPRGQNTLIHKININKNNLSYQDSVILPGRPLTQYSMDEYKGDFRILTSINNWSSLDRKQYTNLYILDKDLKIKGSLTKLGEGENFKSSRYIGDKLYLVTFKQIDPLFVIDVKDSSNPKILGKLKIPGYSTYLHPYDENHLIGIGYDTETNKWGGTINGGLKIDLYNISDFNNPKQTYSYTLGERRSYSEALNNPRMFMWNSKENKLFLPATLYKNDKKDLYRHIDFFQGLVVLDIDKDKGIKEDYRLTHIDYSNMKEQREKDCNKYTVKIKEERCHKLLNGEEYCESSSNRYVPKYCYADSNLGEYIASKNWLFRDSFIKRALWIGNNVFSISNKLIKENNINTGELKYSLELK